MARPSQSEPDTDFFSIVNRSTGGKRMFYIVIDSHRPDGRRDQVMKKRERQRFVKEASALLLSLGAVQQGEDFVLQTKAGRLTLHAEEENRREWLGTVYAVFDDPKAARQLVGCSRFCGRWNQHHFHDWTVETALYDLKYQLKSSARGLTPNAIVVTGENMAEERSLPGWPKKKLVKEVRSHLWHYGIRPTKFTIWQATWTWAAAIAKSYCACIGRCRPRSPRSTSCCSWSR